MKRFLPILFIAICLSAVTANAGVYIVDNGSIETADNTSWSGVDGAAYTTDTFPSGAVGYNSLEDIYNSGSGVSGLGPGDEIYLRGGTYNENYGSIYNTAMPLPWTVDGTSFEEAGRILFSSYPGEWAVFASTVGDACALGRQGQGDTQSTGDDGIPEYWILERFEVSNTSTASSACGIGIHGGPWKVRYVYIHDVDGTDAENTGGMRGYSWRDGSTVEYCYIKDIGSTDHWNIGGLTIFSDYEQSRGSTDIDACRNQYEIRYNIISGVTVGVKDKALQYLKTNAADMTYEDYGPNIHHNIFIGDGSAGGGTGGSFGVESDTEFAQIHNNILDTCRLQLTLNRGGVSGSDVSMLDKVVYNNTIINEQLSFGVGYDENPGINKDFRAYAYNNIITNYANDTYGPSIGFFTQACYGGNCSSAIASCTPNWTTSIVDRNFIHDPQYTDHISEPYSRGVTSRWYTVPEFNAYQSVTNYTNATDGLFLGESGASQYVTDGTFVLTGSTTIANGGINTTHPYLSGVSLPSYVGATNPSDYGWVAGVLAMNASYFTSQENGSDPTWVEGSEETPDTTAPSISGLNPTASATNVSKATDIVAHVTDAGDGVDQSTIVMTVEGSAVTPTITGTSADYTLTFDSPSDFNYDDEINVTIDADDLASTPNSMTQYVYSFTIESEPSPQSNTGTVMTGVSNVVTTP